MAVIVLTNCYVLINAVDLSNKATSITLKIEADDQDSTAFGSTYHTRVGGLKDWSADIEFNADFAASAVDATLFPLLGTSVAVEFRPDAGARSTTNPGYTGNLLVTEYTPLDGSVGDLGKVKVSWPGNGAIARQTS